jgi:hypothetical protein
VHLAIVLLFALEVPAEALRAVPGADVVVFDEPQVGKQTRILLATHVRAAPAKLMALFTDPAAYRRAVPSFRRAEVVEAKGGERRVRWELEVPLWNLKGELWLRPVAGGVDLELAAGDLAPGMFRLRAQADGEGALFWMEAQANVREANWVARRLVARSPLAEPAMTAAAALVLLRALALEAVGAGAQRWPATPPAPPKTVDGTPLAKALALGGRVVAAVHSAPTGRLARVEVAIAPKVSAAAVRQAVTEPARWRALPGWRDVAPLKKNPGVWEVDSRFPFVDFDADWAVSPRPFRAVAVGGDARGAIMGWDVADTPVAVFSFHPRLETAGYIPRKFIEAEPLLEHGLSLGLTYVDAMSFLEALLPRPKAAPAK